MNKKNNIKIKYLFSIIWYNSHCTQQRVNIIGQGYCVVISSSWKILALSCTIPWTGIPFTGKYHLSPPVKYYYLGGAPTRCSV